MLHAGDVEAKRSSLRRKRLFAGSLLVFAALLFAGTRLVPEPSFFIRLIGAASEAAIVGGLADWFAVTALFRRPLGLPIPHTALIPARKNDLGRSLGDFVSDQFLDPQLLIARMRRENWALRLAQWSNSAAAANFLAERAVTIVPLVLDGINDSEIRKFLRGVIREGLGRIDLFPALDGAIANFARGGGHMKIADALADVARPSLRGIRAELIAKVGERTGRYFPTYFDRKIAEALIVGAEKWLDAIKVSGSEERAKLDVWIRARIGELREAPDYPSLIAQAQRAVAGNPALVDSLDAIWAEIKRELMADAQSPAPKIGIATANIVRTAGRLIEQSPVLQDYLNAAVEGLLVNYVKPWRLQIGNYIAEVVAGWDGPKVAAIIELQVGGDLQYIRINGTLVGALIGSALFLIGYALPAIIAF